MPEIRGSCIDSESGEPIVNSRVELMSISTPAFKRRTATDDGGRFAFSGIPPGSYEVTLYSSLHFPASVVTTSAALTEVTVFSAKMYLSCSEEVTK